MTHQIIYSSQASRALSLTELERILVDARAGNQRRQVTGALVYVDGVFLQILEGDRDTVRALMDRIAADTRHGLVKVFYEAEIEQPLFSSWHMAFLNATPDQCAEWAGLAGDLSIEAILDDVHAQPQRAAQFAERLLQVLAD